MDRRFIVFVIAITATIAAPRTLRAELIVDQRPYHSGGQESDTEFIYFGQPFWQELADDVVLTEDATVRQIRWWGFYGSEECGISLPPTGAEPMRVRFYAAREGDSLPGDLVFDETFSDAHRYFTGDYVESTRPEFNYWVNPSAPIPLLSGRRYWLSVSQVGIPESCFRWEFSPGNNTPYAGRWTFEPGWQYTTLNADQAFQLLSVPEPKSALLTGAGLGFVIVVSKSQKEGGSRAKG